jgi:transposase
MTSLAIEQLDQFSRQELLDLVQQLLAVIEQQQKRMAALEAELDKFRAPPTTSSNSSQPPSRDQKGNQPEQKKTRKHGPPFGHPEYSRPLSDHPDRIITAPVSHCAHCRADLQGVEPEPINRRQVTELPLVKPVSIETQQHQVTCPHCQQLNQGVLPAGLEAEGYFGPNLEAMVVFYKQTQHLSYQRSVETLRDLHGVTLSEGVLANILQRAGEKAQPVAAAIKEQVIQGTVIHSDETSARVKGRNWWQWVFLSEGGVYHTIVPPRRAAEIATVLGEQKVPTWVSDCFSAQLKAPAQVFQLCLAHHLRDLQKMIDAQPQERWARAVQTIADHSKIVPARPHWRSSNLMAGLPPLWYS